MSQSVPPPLHVNIYSHFFRVASFNKSNESFFFNQLNTCAGLVNFCFPPINSFVNTSNFCNSFTVYYSILFDVCSSSNCIPWLMSFKPVSLSLSLSLSLPPSLFNCYFLHFHSALKVNKFNS